MKALVLATLSLLSLNLVCGPSAQADSSFTYDSTLPPALKTKIEGDLNFLNSIKGNGATPLHQLFFGPGAIAGANYTSFVRERITGFLFDMYPKEKIAVAYNINGRNKLYFTLNFVKSDMPQVMRMTVFLHEARHSEKEHHFWHHAKCPDPYLDGNGNVIRSILTGLDLSGASACDKTAFGSYGLQTVTLKNIQAFCTNCTAKVKMDAGIYGDNHINTRFIDQSAKEIIQSDVNE